MFKFKTNDTVAILKGKDKGKVGLIKKIIKKNNKKSILLENLNLVKKNIKANPNKNKAGGITNLEMPISFSNVMLINPKTNKKDKIKFSHYENKKIRQFKSNKEFLK